MKSLSILRKFWAWVRSDRPVSVPIPPWLIAALLAVLGVCFVVWVVVALSAPGGEPEVSVSRLINEIRAGSVRKLEIDSQSIKVTTNSDKIFLVRVLPEVGSYLTLLNNAGASSADLQKIEIERRKFESSNGNWILLIVALVAVVSLFFLLPRWLFGVLLAGSFKPLKPDELEEIAVDWEQIAGLTKAKETLIRISNHLKMAADSDGKLVADLPKGLLLVGPPGTGKTMLARATAHAAGVSFFHVSGSQFIETYVGVGALRIRNLFKAARRERLAVIFIDEIDELGGRRPESTLEGGGGREHLQTVSQLLNELDGFQKDRIGLVIAATNHFETLDPALVRSGRFDEFIPVEKPTLAERKALLEIYTPERRDNSWTADWSERLLPQTEGMTGADIEAAMNYARFLAASRKSELISIQDFEESIDRARRTHNYRSMLNKPIRRD